MLHDEAGGKLARRHFGAQALHLEGAGRAGGDGGEQAVQVQAVGSGVGEGLAHAGQGPGDGDLVGQLGVLARAGGAHVDDNPAHGLEEGEAGVKVGPVAAYQDGQSARLCAGVAAGDRRVQRPQAPGLARLPDAPGQGGGAGGHVHDEGTGAGAGDDSAAAKVDLLHVPGVAHDGEHRLRVPDAPGHCVRPEGAFGDDILAFGLGAAVYGEGISGLHQVAHHGLAHDAHADKRDFVHLNPLLSHL